MSKILKSVNRALLELETGILFYGIVGQVIVLFFKEDRLSLSIGWWIGILMALFGAWHMYRSLDKALDCQEADAVRKMRIASVFRYLGSFLVLLFLTITDLGNFLTCIFALLTLKVSAYTQPFTHKIYNKIFKEQDPIPEPLKDEEFYEIYKGEAEERNKERENL